MGRRKPPPYPEFGRLLTDGIHAVADCKGLTIREVQALIGDEVERGGDAIERWREGRRPPSMEMLAKTAGFLVRNACGKLHAAWLRQFLEEGGYPHPEAFIRRHFPEEPRPPASGGQPPAAPWAVQDEVRDFMGREQELRALIGGFSAGHRWCVIHGLPGVGKLTLASEYAHRRRDEYPGGAVTISVGSGEFPLELEAPAAERVKNALNALASRLEINLAEEQSLADRSLRLRDALQLRKEKTLLILRNVHNFEELEYFRPGGNFPHALIVTSARRSLADEADFGIPLEPFAPEVGVQLLKAVIGPALNNLGPDVDSQLSQIVDYLDGLPFALNLIGKGIQQRAIREKNALQKTIALLRMDADRFEDLDTRLQKAYLISYELLSPPARRCFAALAGFAGHDFAVEAVDAAVEQDGRPPDVNWLMEMDDLSLIEVNHDAPRFEGERPVVRLSLHGQLRRLARRRLESEFTAEARAIRLRIAYFYRDLCSANHSYTQFRTVERDWENVQAALNLLAQAGAWDEFYAGLEALTAPSLGIAGFLDSSGRWTEAIEWLNLAIVHALNYADESVLPHWYFARGVFHFRQRRIDEARQDLREALRRYEALADSPGEMALRRAQVLQFLGDLETAAGDAEKALTCLQEAEKGLRDQETAVANYEIGYTYVRLVPPLAATGQFEKILPRLLESLELLPRDEATPARASAYISLGRIHMIQGRYEEAFESWRLGKVDADELDDLRRKADLSRNIANLRAELGELREAVDAQRVLIHEYERMGDVDGAGKTYSNLGLSYLTLGETDAALAHMDRALDLGRERNLTEVQVHALINLTRYALERGDVDTAERRLREVEELGSGEVQSEFHRLLAAVALHRGAADAARASAEVAIEIAERARNRMEGARARRARAAALSHLEGRAAEAGTEFEAVLAAFEGNRYEAALTQLSYAKHLRREGRTADANAVEREAGVVLGELGLERPKSIT